MAFWDSLINGLKSKNNVQQDNVMSGGIDQNVTPPDNTNNSGNIQDNVKKTNAIVNVLKNAAPTNWSDETRQKVLLASKFLSGFGSTQYNPNENMLGNIANGMSNGANAAFQQMQNYNNYKNTKSLYEQMGLDTTGLNPVGDYSSMTPAQVISLGIRQKQNNIRQEIANANDKTKRLTLIMNNYNKGSISADEAQKLMQMYGLDISDLQESNETKKTNSQIELNNTRKKYIEETIKQNEKKIAILRQRVNQGNATLSDKQTLNKLNIQNKQLLIEQNRLINEGLKNQLNNGGNNNGGNTRPVGQKKGNTVKSF